MSFFIPMLRVYIIPLTLIFFLSMLLIKLLELLLWFQLFMSDIVGSYALDSWLDTLLSSER